MATSSSSSTTQSGAQASPEIKRAKLDLAISLTLSFWPVLSDAVTNEWGGPDSSDKRDWLAGTISDLFTQNPSTGNFDDVDEADIENLLLQVMQDEFNVSVEDDTDVVVARQILALKREVEEGNFQRLDVMYQRWVEREERQKKGGERRKVQVQEQDQDTDEELDDDEDEDEDGDVEMDDAPNLVPVVKPTVQKREPEVDEEGFTKVVGRRR